LEYYFEILKDISTLAEPEEGLLIGGRPYKTTTQIIPWTNHKNNDLNAKTVQLENGRKDSSHETINDNNDFNTLISDRKPSAFSVDTL